MTACPNYFIKTTKRAGALVSQKDVTAAT